MQQVVDQPILKRLRARLVHADHAGDCIRDQAGIGKRCELDEIHLVKRWADGIGELNGQPGLPGSRGAGRCK